MAWITQLPVVGRLLRGISAFAGQLCRDIPANTVLREIDLHSRHFDFLKEVD